MKTARMIVCAAALMTAAGPAVQAFAAEDEGGPVLTLDQALAQARKRNRSLVAERARVLQAQASVDQGWAALFPTVTAQGKYARNNIAFSLPRPIMNAAGMTIGADNLTIQPIDQLDGSVTATVPLLVLAAYPALNAVKTAGQAAQATFDVSESSVLLSVAQLYYAAVISDEVLAARQSNVKVAAATLQNAKVRFQAGTVTKVDVDRAELALVRAEQGQREAVFGRQKTYRALATLTQHQGPFQVQVPNFPAESHDERSAMHAGSTTTTSPSSTTPGRWAPSLTGCSSMAVRAMPSGT